MRCPWGVGVEAVLVERVLGCRVRKEGGIVIERNREVWGWGWGRITDAPPSCVEMGIDKNVSSQSLLLK